MDADALVAAAVVPGGLHPQQALARPQLERRRDGDVDHRRVSARVRRPAVRRDDLQATAQRAAVRHLDVDGDRRVDLGVVVGRAPVVRVADVAAVDEPAQPDEVADRPGAVGRDGHGDDAVVERRAVRAGDDGVHAEAECGRAPRPPTEARHRVDVGQDLAARILRDPHAHLARRGVLEHALQRLAVVGADERAAAGAALGPEQERAVVGRFDRGGVEPGRVVELGDDARGQRGRRELHQHHLRTADAQRLRARQLGVTLDDELDEPAAIARRRVHDDGAAAGDRRAERVDGA